MNLRTALLRIASEDPQLRIHLLPLLSKVAAKDKWISFLKTKYEGGKKKVPNPNPKTRKQHPEVSVSTALKDEGFYKKIREEFEKWEPSSEGSHSDTQKETPLRLKTEEELDHFDQKWEYSKWTFSEKDALKRYAGDAFYEINNHYRSAMPGMRPRADIAPLLSELDSAFSKNSARVSESIEVVRGIATDHPLYKLFRDEALTPGMETQDKGYMSTSVKQEWGWGNLSIRITVPKGTPAIYIGKKLASFPNERELLLNRGTRLRITKVTSSEIHAEVVPQ